MTVDLAKLIERLEAALNRAGREWSYYPLVSQAAEALFRLSVERDELKAELARLYDTRRWNIERDGNDLLICEGDHHRSEKCEFERYVRAETAERQRDEAIERVAAFLAKTYPDNANTNAFCAAIRSLNSPGGA